jgi:hypothetical protein
VPYGDDYSVLEEDVDMLNAELQRAFSRMGARLEINEVQSRWRAGRLQINVRQDKVGEYFTIWNPIKAELQVLNVEPKDRHLLLMSREGERQQEKHRYLLGHDERHWFVAGIPEETPVSSVRDAKQALKPREVKLAEIGLGWGKKDLRHNAARLRQGEWFFVPDPSFVSPSGWQMPVLRNEPISRGRGSKPHICQDLYRSGGETVYVSSGEYSSGLTEAQYHGLNKKVREARNWQVMKRNMDVWVRGTVRHPDHATIKLNGWHKVVSNTEHLSQAMRNIVFLD